MAQSIGLGAKQPQQFPGSIPIPKPIEEGLQKEATPKGAVTQVCASVYGGTPGKNPMGFAELSTNWQNPNGPWDFSALGNLPRGAKVNVTYKGRSVNLEKVDVGRGGQGCGGHPRAIDLEPAAAAALGLPGLDVVIVSGAVSPKEAEEKGVKEKPQKKHCGWVELPGVGGFNMFPVAVCDVLGFIGTAEGWFRIFKVLGGAILILVAFIELAKVGSGGEITKPSLPV